jgi:hypothetical protein
MGNATRPDQHTYTHTYEDERGQLLPPLCVRRPPPVVPPTSRVPVRRSCSMWCGADRPSKKTNSHHSGSFVFTAGKEKKGKKIKKGNLLPCGGGGGARSSLFRDAPDVQRGEPKVKSPRTDGRPADAFFFFSPPPPPRPPPLDSGALHVYAQHHVRQGRSLSHPVQTLAPPQAAAESRAFRPARNSARSRNYLPCGCSGTQLRIPISSLVTRALE